MTTGKMRNNKYKVSDVSPLSFGEGRMRIRLITLIVISFTVSSCTKFHIDYRPETGLVRIYPVPSGSALPALEYRFYGRNAAGEDTTLIRTSDDRGNFEGKLPVGAYRVLAANTADAEAANVVFDMERYETATVTVKDAQPGSHLSVVNCQLLTVAEEVKVTKNGDVRKDPLPVLLTKRLVFVFTLSDGLETETDSITGLLPGVYPSVGLATGLPAGESIDRSLSTSVRFGISEGGVERMAPVGLLGLRDPKGGEAYADPLALTLVMHDKSREEVPVDLTGTFSEIFVKYGGVLPAEVYIAVELWRTSVGKPAGEITGWKGGEEKVIIIDKTDDR
jgi:hypothetical protein